MDHRRQEKQTNISNNLKDRKKSKKRYSQVMALWDLVMAGYSKVSIYLISFMDLGSSFIMDKSFIKVDLIKAISMAMENCKDTLISII